LSITQISFLERSVSGSEISRTKMARALSDIEQVMEREGQLDHIELVAAVMKLRKNSRARGRSRTRSAPAAESAQAASG
jgi:hypothetical protein